jgi:cytochrome b pre-mRNA-processing protein 3
LHPYLTRLLFSECHLPPTFQSWFTITNLHIWILSTRLRALPGPHGDYYVQALVDNFFADVEDRIRAVCGPLDTLPAPSETNESTTTQKLVNPDNSYYPLHGQLTEGGKRRKGAPETFITRQMKMFREQYNGLTFSLDLALAHNSDGEFAGAIWRNLLGSRGSRGIAYENTEAEKEAKVAKDDGSGVLDFVGEDVDQYVRYPETMAALVSYIRRETIRLSAISDEIVMSRPQEELEYLDGLKFQPVLEGSGVDTNKSH